MKKTIFVLLFCFLFVLTSCKSSGGTTSKQTSSESNTDSNSSVSEETTYESDINYNSSIAEETTPTLNEEENYTEEEETHGVLFSLFDKFVRLFDYDKFADRTFNKFVDAVKNQDKTKMKSLFSNNAIEAVETLDEDIDELFAFIEGTITYTSTVDDMGGISSSSYRDYGKRQDIIDTYFTIDTDSQRYYVAFIEYIKDDFDRDNEGVYCIRIINTKDWHEECIYRTHGNENPGIIID